jgi:hypothetical protein
VLPEAAAGTQDCIAATNDTLAKLPVPVSTCTQLVLYMISNLELLREGECLSTERSKSATLM